MIKSALFEGGDEFRYDQECLLGPSGAFWGLPAFRPSGAFWGSLQSQVGTQGVATFASVFGVLFGFTVSESVRWGAYQWLIHSE
jgi:hypothetical protein